MNATAAVLIAGFAAIACMLIFGPANKPAPANTETLTCVRVKEVTPAGTINYLCEVRK